MLSYFKNTIKSIRQKYESIQIMKEYIEGRIEIEKFWDYCKYNKIVLELLNKKEKLVPLHHDNKDITKFEDRIVIYFTVKKFLERKKYKINAFNKEEERYNLIYEVTPDWLYLDDINYINDIINSAPSGLSMDEIKLWCKDEFTKKFRYDKYPPEWLTSFKWPIVNGKPLVFKEMIENLYHDLIVNDYIFYDDVTKEETKITQSDYI